MAEEKRGIEETKDILDFMFSFVEAVGKAKKDGEMSWSDARYFIDPVKKLFEAVDDIEGKFIDFAETHLKEQIEKGSTPATIFYLKTRGRKRGYNDTLDITSDNEPIIIEFNIDASNTDTNE